MAELYDEDRARVSVVEMRSWEARVIMAIDYRRDLCDDSIVYVSLIVVVHDDQLR